MNPTDKVDDQLAKAGAQWRASQPSAPEPDLDRITGGKHPKRRWLIPTLAAASVAAIATAVLVVLPDDQKPAVAPPPSKAAPQAAEGSVTAGKPSADDLLVRNGDKVQTDGLVIVTPGQDPIFCAPQPEAVPLPLIEPAPERPAPSCRPENSIKLVGLDPDRLTNPETIKGVRIGTAHLVGIWKDRTITVEKQTAFHQRQEPPQASEALPCAEPPGGWPSRPSNILSKRVQNFLTANSGQVYGPIFSYPHGHSRGAPVVIRLGVAHTDVEAFRKSFETIYDGNLCLYPTKLSVDDNQRIGDALGTLMSTRKELGLQAGGGQGMDGDHVELSLVVFDEAAKTALAPIGLEYLDLDVDVKPVR